MGDQRKRRKKESKSMFIRGKLSNYQQKKRYTNSLQTHIKDIDSVLTISSIYPTFKVGQQLNSLKKSQNLSLKKINKLKRGLINKTVYLNLQRKQNNMCNKNGFTMSIRSSENNNSVGNEKFPKKHAKGGRYSHNPNSIFRQKQNRQGDEKLEIFGAKMSIYDGSGMDFSKKGEKVFQQADQNVNEGYVNKPIELVTVGKSRISQSQTLYLQNKKSIYKQPSMIINSIKIRNNNRNQSYTLNLNSTQSYFYSLTQKNNPTSSIRRENPAIWKTWQSNKCQKEDIKKNNAKLRLHRADSPHFQVGNSLFITAK